MSDLKVYGTHWCEDTAATREHLDSLRVRYDFIDVDADHAALHWIKSLTGGKRVTPVVDVAGLILITPDQTRLKDALFQRGFLSPDELYFNI